MQTGKKLGREGKARDDKSEVARQPVQMVATADVRIWGTGGEQRSTPRSVMLAWASGWSYSPVKRAKGISTEI